MVSQFYVLEAGYGVNGGFGDYVGVDWEGPVTLNNNIVWFHSQQHAEHVADALTQQAYAHFMSQGEHDPWDGNFAYEYRAQIVTIPDNSASDDDGSLIERLSQQDREAGLWDNIWGDMTDDEDDDDLPP